jgi:hypothetical protein
MPSSQPRYSCAFPKPDISVSRGRFEPGRWHVLRPAGNRPKHVGWPGRLKQTRSPLAKELADWRGPTTRPHPGGTPSPHAAAGWPAPRVPAARGQACEIRGHATCAWLRAPAVIQTWPQRDATEGGGKTLSFEIRGLASGAPSASLAAYLGSAHSPAGHRLEHGASPRPGLGIGFRSSSRIRSSADRVDLQAQAAPSWRSPGWRCGSDVSKVPRREPLWHEFCGQCAAPLAATCASCGSSNPPGEQVLRPVRRPV